MKRPSKREKYGRRDNHVINRMSENPCGNDCRKKEMSIEKNRSIIYEERMMIEAYGKNRKRHIRRSMGMGVIEGVSRLCARSRGRKANA